MTPLSVEAYTPSGWKQIGQVGPNDRPGSLSDNRPDRRDVYLFGCLPDDSASVVTRSRGGVDACLCMVRVVDIIGEERVATLYRGQTYGMDVMTDGSKERRKIRFTHV